MMVQTMVIQTTTVPREHVDHSATQAIIVTARANRSKQMD